MKSHLTFFASLLVLMPSLAQAQPGVSGKAAAPAAPVAAVYSQEKTLDVCTTASRSE